ALVGDLLAARRVRAGAVAGLPLATAGNASARASRTALAPRTGRQLPRHPRRSRLLPADPGGNVELQCAVGLHLLGPGLRPGLAPPGRAALRVAVHSGDQ